MRIVEIKKLENGAHRNQNSSSPVVHEGWAVIPNDMDCENFPFGEVTAEEIDGIMTVTRWVAGEIPPVEPEPEVEEEPTSDELLDILLGVSE